MRTKTFLFLALFCYTTIYAQNRIIVSYNPGLSLFNSENSMKIIGDKKVDWIQGFSIAYGRDNFIGSVNLDLEYSFMYSRVPGVQNFNVTSSSGPYSIATFSADLVLVWHSVDIDLNWRISKWLSFSIGPSISYVGRSIVIDNLPYATQENGPTSFEDRLQSLCIGLNGSVNVEIPLQDDNEYFFLLIHSRTRFLHAIWFDARGRNLDNYYQTFRLGQINIGVGYCF